MDLETEIEIELGKTYRLSTADKDSDDKDDYVTIVGRVDPETFEYEDGYLFYSDNGLLFTPDGWCEQTEEYFDLNIEDEIDGDRFSMDSFTLSIYPHTLVGNPNLIGRDDPTFKVIMGATYIDRMGLFHLIQEVSGLQHEGPEVLYKSDACTYDIQGLAHQNNRPSMYDLIYQIKSSFVVTKEMLNNKRPLLLKP